MGYPDFIANNAIRVSLGPNNVMEEIKKFVTYGRNFNKDNN